MLLTVPVKTWLGIGIQANIGLVAKPYVGEIVFINVAEDPHVLRSEIVKGFGEPRPGIPAAFVTC